MNGDSSSIAIRSARADDLAWIVELVPRLHEFGPPPWRTIDQMNAAEHADLTRALASLDDAAALFAVAERQPDGVPLGFVYVGTSVDFFTGEQHAHVKDLVVAKAGEGQGVARRLLDAADGWTRERGYRFITLSVFPDNARALQLYERAGFRTDVLRMLKQV